MKTQDCIKVKDVKIQDGVPVKEGIFILIPIDQKKDPMGSGAPNYFVVSETENIEVGDYVYNQSNGNIFKTDNVLQSNNCNHNEIGKPFKKILILPENFSPEIIEDIVNGKLKNGEKVLIRCEAMPNEFDNPMSNPEGVHNTEDSEYEIKLNEKNHISFYSIEEYKKRQLKSLFRSYFEGVGDYVEPIDALSIFSLGITDIQFEFKPDVIEMIITLERPGLLIGKGGRTIDGVTEFLSKNDTPVKIKIIESKLWR